MVMRDERKKKKEKTESLNEFDEDIWLEEIDYEIDEPSEDELVSIRTEINDYYHTGEE